MDIFLEILGKLRGDFVDIFLEERITNQFQMEENKVQKTSTVFEKGLGVRVIRDGKISYAFTNDFSKKGIDELLTLLMNKNSSGKTFNIKKLIKHQHDKSFLIKIEPHEVPLSKKFELLRKANYVAWAESEKIKQVKTLYSDSIQIVKIANSEGFFTEEQRTYTLFLIQVVAHEDGVIQTGYESLGGLKGFEFFQENNLEEVAKKTAQRALMMLKAKRIKGGRMPVIISSEAGGTMIHEAIGHGLEADLVYEGLSIYSNKLGQKVASDLITVIDDPTLPNMRGSYIFDDEGTPSQRTVLVEKGVLVNYLYDKYNAMKEGKKSTGNGRRQSYEYYPIPRMSNTFIAPGNHKPEEILRSVEKGFFVKKMGGGQVNTVTGEFVFEVQEGYTIEKGNISDPVRGALLIGTGQEILQNIDMVGNDLGFSIGTCGKNSQGVPVTDGMPTVRIPEIVVGGEA